MSLNLRGPPPSGTQSSQYTMYVSYFVFSSCISCKQTHTQRHRLGNNTRLNTFAHSWFYNATAVRGALWWLRQSHSVNYANHQHSPDGANPIFQFLAPKKLFVGPSPHFVATLETIFFPLSFGKSFMKIRSAVPENGCLIFCGEREKNRKKRKHL